ncbi:MAG: peptide-methionine (S)-S-oxide reductase MsrA [Candidatus Kapabacteria bacterium]|nr:peptide-methionine (S)-S-oxide reductase MsrA [Candidatus Kapabacteria bacterium]
MKLYIIFLIVIMVSGACAGETSNSKGSNMQVNTNTESIVLGGGCFWCIEAVFLSIEGVVSAESGYTGGTTQNPTYNEVCSGNTGHAEVVKITFNKDIISIEEIFGIFFTAHDPTTLNRQGADVGTQYRSAVFYTNDEQKSAATNYIKLLNEENVYSDPIVTEVSKLVTFYPAEEYHNDYYFNNKNQSYCRFVINPKLEKVKSKFSSKIKQR